MAQGCVLVACVFAGKRSMLYVGSVWGSLFLAPFQASAGLFLVGWGWGFS